MYQPCLQKAIESSLGVFGLYDMYMHHVLKNVFIVEAFRFSLTAVHGFDNGCVRKQPVTWGKYCADNQ